MLDRTKVSWRQHFGGTRYRVTPDGVEIEGGGIQRTRGEPVTMRRILSHWREELLHACRSTGVPLEILLMTIATEAGPITMQDGVPTYARHRREPGYVSDEKTPDKVSFGPCHVLLSTGRATLGRKDLTSAQLAELKTNLLAAACYLRDQQKATGYDPVLAAAAYNAGSIREAGPGSRFFNRWRLACWTQPGYCHIDQAVKWYGDALAALKEKGLQLWPEPKVVSRMA